MADQKPKIGDRVLLTIPGPDDTLEIISQATLSGESDVLWHLSNGGTLRKSDLLDPETTGVYRYKGVLMDSDLGKSLAGRVDAMRDAREGQRLLNDVQDYIASGNLVSAHKALSDVTKFLENVEKVVKPVTRRTPAKKTVESED